MKIYIDPGHNPTGNHNTGAVGNGMTEQDIVFTVSRELAKILENNGYQTKLSRPEETTVLGTCNRTSINARWQEANTWGADYFISVHTNASGTSAHGTEIFYFNSKDSRGDKSYQFAKSILDGFTTEFPNLRNRGVKPDTQTAAGSLGVLRNTKMPAVLIELAFIDAPAHYPDVQILKKYRYEMARAMSNAIYEYFSKIAKTTVDFDFQGQIIKTDGYVSPDGRTFVAVRELLEPMGYKVNWNSHQEPIQLTKATL
jgi:N-acetylmuramoyl-L-alanine amidase